LLALLDVVQCGSHVNSKRKTGQANQPKENDSAPHATFATTGSSGARETWLLSAIAALAILHLDQWRFCTFLAKASDLSFPTLDQAKNDAYV
jgi:hypothetical protein